MATSYPGFRYDMGFQVNGTPIPDPNKFTGAVSDLDTMGKRDANGLLHRKRVATKHPLKFEYTNIPYTMMQTICNLISSDAFQFTYYDPAVGATRTMKAYTGDRNWEVVKAVWNQTALVTLKFSIIEY